MPASSGNQAAPSGIPAEPQSPTTGASDLDRLGEQFGQPTGEQIGEQSESAAGPARLRALTRISVDGDTVVYVPEDAGDLDAALWAIHSDMVARTQAVRAEKIRTAAAEPGGNLGTVRPF